MRRLVLVLFALVAAAPAVTILVPSQQPTIQAGLNAAQSGDTVLVAPGTYHERITWPNRDGIRLLSDSGASQTTVDAGGLGRVVHFNSADITRATVIRGFTLTNGSSDGAGIRCTGCSPSILDNRIAANKPNTSERNYGGGIHLYGWYTTTAPLIMGNEIVDNVCYGTEHRNYGGGIHAAGEHSAPEICYNLIARNKCLDGWYDYGAALYLDDGAALVYQNVIAANVDSGPTFVEGGAISIWDTCRAYIFNNLIVGNRAMGSTFTYGGGIACRGPNAVIINNTAVGNRCMRVGGSFTARGGGLYLGSGGSAYVQNNIFAHDTADEGSAIYNANTTVMPGLLNNDYYDCTLYGCSPGPGDITLDPLFAPGGYRLSQTAAGQPSTSPCVDAGETLPVLPQGLDTLISLWTTRTDGVPDAGAIDMGYHYLPYPQVGIEEAAYRRPRTASLSIEPNPARRIAALRFRGFEGIEGANLCVFDALGRVVLERPLGHLTDVPLSLDLRTLDASVYIVRLSAGTFTATEKLVVQR